MRHLALIWITIACIGVRGQISDLNDEGSALIELVESDYDDQFCARTKAEWELLNTNSEQALDEKMEIEKSYGNFVRSQSDDVRENILTNSGLQRKLELLLKPGDTMLVTQQWNKLVSFAEQAEFDLRNANNIDCHKNIPQNCNMTEYLNTLATSKDRHVIASAKASWETKLPDKNKFETDILPLLKNASNDNEMKEMREYWDMLAECDDAFGKADVLWNEIKPLYTNLKKYVALKIQKNNGSIRADGSIPSHWLGSLFGEDWSNIAGIVLPKINVYNKINHQLRMKQLGGQNGFLFGNNMLKQIKLGTFGDKFWINSNFSGTCPLQIGSYCKPNGKRVHTCDAINIPQFMDILDASMTIQHAKHKAQKSINTYIIREANRYSALDEAITGLGSMIGMSPDYLRSQGILSASFNEMDDKLSLEFLMALRDLPRLAYYLDADQWRLELLEHSGPVHIGNSWAEKRRENFVSPSDNDFMGDPQIISNKPYIGKFLGTVLKYQIFQEITDDIYGEEKDVTKMIAKNSNKIKSMMETGFNKKWQDTINDELSLSEVNSESLLTYYDNLNNFLEKELNPDENSANTDDDSHNDFDTGNDDFGNHDDFGDHDDFEVPNHESAPEAETITDKNQNAFNKPHADKDESAWPSDSESTTHYKDNPHLIPKDNGNTAASSSDLANAENRKEEGFDADALQYAWIGLGVLALVLILLGVIIIGRKRYKHKKELERERRQGSA